MRLYYTCYFKFSDSPHAQETKKTPSRTKRCCMFESPSHSVIIQRYCFISHTLSYMHAHTHIHTLSKHIHTCSHPGPQVWPQNSGSSSRLFSRVLFLLSDTLNTILYKRTAKITPDFYFTYNQEWKFYSKDAGRNRYIWVAEPFFPFYKNTLNSAHFATQSSFH